LTAIVFWRCDQSENGLEQSVGTNLILCIDNGNGFQDGFEGAECFGWPLHEIDCNCGKPKSAVNPASLFDW
jgi:hypothetical protein